MCQVCVDSVESAFNAARGGASRLEVCSALSEGGLTPSPGLLTVIQENVTIPCFAMIRPRTGDFVYSEMELLAMEKDICAMIDSGAKGLVFGCLDIKGDVDVKQVTRLVSTAKTKQSDISLTFHRAIDMARDLHQAAATVAQLGFERILTSGGHSKALDGMENIAALVRDLGDKVIVMPGGGISEDNLEEIQTKTKVRQTVRCSIQTNTSNFQCVEFHASARVVKSSQMEHQNPTCSLGQAGRGEYSLMVTSTDRVAKLIKIYKVTFFK